VQAHEGLAQLGSLVGKTANEPCAVNDYLGELIDAACAGRFLAADGGVTVVPTSHPTVETVVAFTGHAVIATALSSDVVVAQQPDGFGGAVAPRFLLWLAGERGSVGSHDVLLAAKGLGEPVLPSRDDLEDHPRVQHARTLRRDVRVYADERGLVTRGIGIGGHIEVSVEVVPERRNQGIGRQLVRSALGLVAEGQTVVAEIAPGNAQSLRSFLAAGFTPIGSAVHVRPRR
jgi:GNAT superfamily N-acetyltransferase